MENVANILDYWLDSNIGSDIALLVEKFTWHCSLQAYVVAGKFLIKVSLVIYSGKFSDMSSWTD